MSDKGQHCYRCGFWIEQDEPLVFLPKSDGTEKLALCMDCVDDLADQFKSALDLVKQIRSRQWIGCYGE